MDMQMAQQGESSRNRTDSHVIEMTELANELKGKLSALNSSNPQAGDSQRPRPIIIAKVCELTRNVDSVEYDPDHIAIGPQSRKPHLAMELDKLTSLQAMVSTVNCGAGTVDDFIKELTCLEESVRKCYATPFDDMNGMQFARMLLLDGCYILHHLVDLQAHPQPQPTDDGVPSMERADALAVVRDMFYLVENQIPFFVLQKIGELTAWNGRDRVIEQLTKHALDLMIKQKYAVAAPAMVPPEQMVPANLLHLVHMQLKPNDLPTSPAATILDPDGEATRRWRSATEYYIAGVTFKRRKMRKDGRIRCILDVKLSGSGGTLEIPCLDIDNETWSLLRNLMQLEQQNREADVGSHITAYCVFMSQVACTTKDVEFLCKRGVIVHGHGNDDEVAKCFADLCKGIMFNPNDAKGNYLLETWDRLEKRFLSKPHRWMAWLKHKYFSSPWHAIGLLVAVILLVCGVIQAHYSVLTYKHG